MTKILMLAAGSVAGGFARYYMTGFVNGVLGAAFPYGTFAVNIIGCFLVGLFSVLAGKQIMIGPDEKLLLITGFCGAFTTFSAFMLETHSLTKDGEVARAFLNVMLSVAVGFVFLRLGILLGESV